MIGCGKDADCGVGPDLCQRGFDLGQLRARDNHRLPGRNVQTSHATTNVLADDGKKSANRHLAELISQLKNWS